MTLTWVFNGGSRSKAHAKYYVVSCHTLAIHDRSHSDESTAVVCLQF